MSLIVIIDDRVTNRAIYSKLAETIGEGVTVKAFGDPGEALEWVERHRPDLIVTDYDMPKIDGAEFISRFRAMPHSAGVPIMMITVNDQRMLRLRALETGATDFLKSPIDHYEFLSRARNLLQLRQGAGNLAENLAENFAESLAGAEKGDPLPGARDAAAAAGEANESPDLTPIEAPGETAALLAQCGEAGDYALHVIEIEETGERKIDPSAVVSALRQEVRGTDVVAPIDRQRFAVLQKNVADSSDANACARRLIDLRPKAGGVLQIGTSLPRPGDSAPEGRAADRLREAVALVRQDDGKLDGRFDGRLGHAKEFLRFLPRIDLRSGEIRGAQALRGFDPAEVGDAAALRAALACASALRLALRRPFLFSLRLRLGDDGAAPTALLLAPLLTETRVPPCWLDLRICAREALAQKRRAEEEARALIALGVGLTLDLGALAPRDRRGDGWIDALNALSQGAHPTIMIPCGENGAVALVRRLAARSLTERSLGRARVLLADGVASAALLPALLRNGIGQAQGTCFGAPFAARDLIGLLAPQPDVDRPSSLKHRA